MSMFRAFLLVLCLLSGAARAEGVTVFAAASLKTALDEVAEAFQAQSGTPLVISYAGSSALARQVQLGAPADVFISANVAWMDVLEADGLIATTTRHNLLGNRLALIAHGEEQPVAFVEIDLPARLGDGRLAMALVGAVPAGIYGRQALTRLGLWDKLVPQIAQTDNVRAALALVSLGEAPLGITYQTDAMADPNVSVLSLFPENSHDPILYPVAALSGRETIAQPLLDFLHGEDAKAIFHRHGFTEPGDD